ncbi:GNAT family N-acetyltransferase [Alkaliphilus oremlandii]|uniref:GCN5-related N-acetyltransferase n=1 Tax=Alkaliphilus oremlandii (strain OhILAs) TaxID=350688 RepID=A8MF18_ALKOO|nr:GNAT family N-acetyltransferase [Alkaliphilus oremlandii]ABW18687.1 GCN5-related N-acetyltransferase [Alkaliphilus oremlandii OhILAs]
MITPILESKRILLRPLSINDARHIFKRWTSDSEVAKFMIWDLHKSVDDTMEWLKIEVQNINNEYHYVWGFVLKETGELFGSGSINFKEELGCYELGYNIMKKYWGQGLTTEAGKVILDFATKILGEKKFFCRHAVDNIGSKKVMTKLGFKYYADSSYTSFNGEKTFLSQDYYLMIE